MGHSDTSHCSGYLQTDPVVTDQISNNEQCNNIGNVSHSKSSGSTESQLRLPLENKFGSVNINSVFDSDSPNLLNVNNLHNGKLTEPAVPPEKNIHTINKRSYDNKISLSIFLSNNKEVVK